MRPGDCRILSRDAHVTMKEMTILELQSQIEAGELTTSSLTASYLARIEPLDTQGPGVNAVIDLNPDALDIAIALDTEQQPEIIDPVSLPMPKGLHDAELVVLMFEFKGTSHPESDTLGSGKWGWLIRSGCCPWHNRRQDARRSCWRETTDRR